MAFPAFQSAIQGSHVGSDGSFWLRLADSGAGPFKWMLFDREGRAYGEVAVARNSRVVWSAGNTFWAVEHDEVAVPWLVRYTLRTAKDAGAAGAAGQPQSR
jgi:hypothetical protein